MCWMCDARAALSGRRGFLRAATAAAGASALAPVWGQVQVGQPSALRSLVPAAQLESAASQQYAQLLAQARAKGALAPDGHPQLRRLRTIAQRLVPHALP